VITTPQHGGHDAQPRKCVRQRVERTDRFLASTPLNVDIELHQLIELVRGRDSDHQHAQRIADEFACHAVAQKSGMVGEDPALARLFHVRLQLHGAGALRIDKDLIQHPQMPQKILSVIWRGSENESCAGPGFADYPRWIRHQCNSDRRAAHN
jgi:hypothetical protein